MTQQKIEKIYFLIHPLCYAPNAGDPEFVAKYRDYIDYEKMISKRWYEAISKMKSNEALVVGAPGCPKELEDFVESHLGRRGLIVRDVIVQQPELWDQLLGKEAQIGLGRDLLAMYWKHGFKWASDPLGQPVIARGWAERIKRTFEQRKLVFDPKTVQAEGWGESFEGCVANYTRYLGTYLKLANPIEDNFEMTVPDTRFLLTARFLEMIPMERSVRLYLWEAEDGRLIAWFHKSLATIGDPSLFARFPLGSMKIEVRDRHKLLWPIRDSPVEWAEGWLKVPVWGAHYVLTKDTDLADFHDVMVNVNLVESDPD